METIEYAGWKDCIRLSNGAAEVVALTAVGPRLIHYGFLDGPNAFHVLPQTRGKTGGEEWRSYGGHRLWIAPEAKPFSFHPDNAPVETVEMDGGTLHLGNGPETTTGVRKDLFVTLAPQGTAVRVVHQLTNHNTEPVTLSVWGLSIVANGGRVVFPQEPFVPHDDDVLPARPLVLWKFTDMADPRWRWGRRYISLRQDDSAATPQKLGLYQSRGWGMHLTLVQALIVQAEVAPGGPAAYPDLGCNFETYTEGPFQELETLGPLHRLDPGQSATHTEYWTLARTEAIPEEDEALDAHLLPLIDQARQETVIAFGR